MRYILEVLGRLRPSRFCAYARAGREDRDVQFEDEVRHTYWDLSLEEVAAGVRQVVVAASISAACAP